MTLPGPSDLYVMGDGIRAYRPSVFNPNMAINRIFAPSARVAFPDKESALILQQKKIPDVSFWQGEIDWDLMRSKTDSIIIRAGQNVWPDTQFERNWAEARARGMNRSTYWFYDGLASPGAQAERWNARIQGDRPEMEIIIDWERNFGGSHEGLGNVVAFMERMEEYGYEVALYTGYFWFIANSNRIANASHYNYLKSRPLHLAWYTDNAANVLIPFPWLELWMWQFGTPAEGPAHGAKSEEIDMNFINMSDPHFYLRYGGTEPQPDPEPEEDMNFELTVLALGLNVRAGAGIENPITGSSLRKDDKVFSNDRIPDSDGVWWYRVASVFRGGLNVPTTGNGWASAGATGGYMRLDNATEPEPTPGTLPVLQVAVSGDGYESVIVEMRPR